MHNAITQESYTLVALNATGYASNVSGASWVLTANDAGDALAHPVTIHNDSATDHSAKTALLTGTDANGQALTETLALPAGTATTTSTKLFKTLTSIVPSATVGADTMDIGWTAIAAGPWHKMNYQQHPFQVGFSLVKGGTINYDVQQTLDLTLAGASSAFAHGVVAGKTVSAYDTYVTPVHGVRFYVNSHTSGTVVFTVIQGGN